MARDSLLEGIARIRLSGSKKTRYNHVAEAKRFVAQLRRLGYGVEKWVNLDNGHVASVVEAWKAAGLTDKTIKEYLSGVRAVLAAYGNDRVRQDNASFGLRVGTSTPSNRDKGCNPEQYERALSQLYAGDGNGLRVGLQAELMRRLGLRHEEARKFDARHAKIELSASGNAYARVIAGTKGGKEREVRLFGLARAAIAKVAEFQKEASARNLMPSGVTEREWEGQAYRLARRAGMTTENRCNFHSLRHSYAHDLFELVAGFPPPVKFETPDLFIHAAQAVCPDWREAYEFACQEVEKALGHEPGRSDIRGVYLGRI